MSDHRVCPPVEAGGGSRRRGNRHSPQDGAVHRRLRGASRNFEKRAWPADLLCSRPDEHASPRHPSGRAAGRRSGRCRRRRHAGRRTVRRRRRGHLDDTRIPASETPRPHDGSPVAHQRARRRPLRRRGQPAGDGGRRPLAHGGLLRRPGERRGGRQRRLLLVRDPPAHGVGDQRGRASGTRTWRARARFCSGTTGPFSTPRVRFRDRAGLGARRPSPAGPCSSTVGRPWTLSTAETAWIAIRGPRSASAEDRRTLILAVVDGRSNASIGMNCAELADLMDGLGAHRGR
jgi:hypothetical protein